MRVDVLLDPRGKRMFRRSRRCYNCCMSIAENSALDRLLGPFSDCLNREAAERIVQFRIDDAVQARADELAERANEDSLTPDERTEYQDYVDAADLIGFFKLKARRLLQGGNSS